MDTKLRGGEPGFINKNRRTVFRFGNYETGKSVGLYGATICLGGAWLPMRVHICDCSLPNLLSRRGLEILRAEIGVGAKRIQPGAANQGVTVHVSEHGLLLLDVRDSRTGCDRFLEHTVLVSEDLGRSLNPPSGIPPPSPRSVRAGATGCKSGRERDASCVGVGRGSQIGSGGGKGGTHNSFPTRKNSAVGQRAEDQKDPSVAPAFKRS